MGVLQGQTALVTGASSGLGADFARELARRGANLVLVARREERLQALAQELRARYGVLVGVIKQDLTEEDAPQRLFELLEREGVAVDVLVNNAGFGLYGKFLEIDWAREREMLELDILVPVLLTKLFAREMVRRRHGYLLHVASVGAYQPSPLYATYSAAKSFLLNFGEALHVELQGTGVRSCVVSPGVTATEFLSVSGQRPTLYQRLVRMESAEVARIGIGAMLRGCPSLVPGRLNALMVWSNRLMTRPLSARVAERLMRSRSP